jgi:histidinol-phosphate aminotransferase
MLAAIERHRPAITYLAYPNNPTANLFDEARSSASSPRSARRRHRRDGRGVPAVLLAQLDARAGSLPHVVVMRTLSKFGLAGVRLGYLAGPAALVDEIDKVRPPYNIGALNAEATLFALEHADEFARRRRRSAPSAEKLQAALLACRASSRSRARRT